MEAEERRRRQRRDVELGRSAPRRTYGAVGGPPAGEGVEGGGEGYFGNPGAVVRSYGTDAGMMTKSNDDKIEDGGNCRGYCESTAVGSGTGKVRPPWPR